MTTFLAKDSRVLTRLNSALLQARADGDQEAIQFIELERGRFERIGRNKCLDCGVPLSGPSNRCLMHDNARRRGKSRK